MIGRRQLLYAVCAAAWIATVDMALAQAPPVQQEWPVYAGDHELAGLGAWGQWNVGNWCEDVQRAWVEQDL